MLGSDELRLHCRVTAFAHDPRPRLGTDRQFGHTGGMRYAVLGMLLVGSLALVPSARADTSPPEDAPVVRLITAGKAPTRTLRLIAKPGFRQTVIMTMAMGMAMQSAGKDLVPKTRVPEVRMTIELDVVNVSGDGDLRCTFKITRPELAQDPKANPAVVAAMKQSILGLDGLSGFVVMTSRGFTREADFQVPATADPQLKELLNSMRQSLYQLTSPLPAEPVGKGARWETTMKLEMNGVSLGQIATYDLVELSGNSAKLDISLKQTAGNQKIQRNGISIDLISLASAGSGHMALDLTRLIASPATMSIKSASEMEAMGQKISMQVDLTMGIKRR